MTTHYLVASTTREGKRIVSPIPLFLKTALGAAAYRWRDLGHTQIRITPVKWKEA